MLTGSFSICLFFTSFSQYQFFFVSKQMQQQNGIKDIDGMISHIVLSMLCIFVFAMALLCVAKKKTFSDSFFFYFHNKSFIYGLKSKKIIVLCVRFRFISDWNTISAIQSPLYFTFLHSTETVRSHEINAVSVLFLSVLPKMHCMHILENCYKYLICLLEVECQTMGQNVYAHIYLERNEHKKKMHLKCDTFQFQQSYAFERSNSQNANNYIPGNRQCQGFG